MSKLREYRDFLNHLKQKSLELHKSNNENDNVYGGVDYDGMIIIVKGDQRLIINEVEAKRILLYLDDITRETILG